jgi:2-iminoacetate synthase ThiH
MAMAADIRDRGFGRHISYSRKVFIPLTQLCRDVCHYCTFAQPPRNLSHAFLSPEQVLEIAVAGKEQVVKRHYLHWAISQKLGIQLRGMNYLTWVSTLHLNT